MQIRRLTTCLLLGLTLLSTTAPMAQAQGKKRFGLGAPFTVEELPKGDLKNKLNKLKPQARAEAIKRLHSFSFPESDAAKYLRVDDDGGVFIVCPIEGCGDDCKNHDHDHEDEATAPEVTGSTIVDDANTPAENMPIGDGSNDTFNPTASVPVSTPPAFQSKPGAPNTIYLDFNGAYVTGKAWSYTDGTTTWRTWDCAAWSTDGDSTTFSVSEQNDIRRMFERVAEDYAPFDVNVTTDVSFDPDIYTGNKNKVGWLLITPTTDKTGVRCPHFGYGGIAYVGVFGSSNYFSAYQPAWVTPMGTANTAEAASHEMGHNMGLSHDGLTTGAAYYGGHIGTSSAPSWGPIMGTGYNRNVSQWSKGEYLNGNQTQDDLAVIANKVTYRTDDHGDTYQTATAWAQSPINQAGLVENTGDPDAFTFTTGAGTVTFSANTYRCDTQTWGANLDVVLELYNASQTLVASSNPLTDTNATLTTSVPAGTYYLLVKPTAAGSPLTSAPSGYTLYGSLGYYTISGTYNPIDSIFVSSPNGGETWLRGASNEITWISGAGGDVSIELLKGDALLGTISSSTPNDGSFTWAIPSSLIAASDYKVRITSLSNPSITAQSVSTFSIVADLLAAALDTTAYTWITSGNTPWFPQSAITSDGVDAAQSGVITHDQSSSIETTLVGPGTLTFSWKVSSESNYDFLRFYINGVEQTGALAAISGEVNWVQKTVTIPAGTQTVKWSYIKDFSVDTGSDAAWVDQVVFTPTAVPGSLAVTPAEGLSASGTFGGTATPSSQQFTLSNTGGDTINWTAAKTQSWLTLSPASGTLAAGATTTVTATIDIGSLNVGIYSDTIVFTNTTNGDGTTTRPVALSVNPATATITLGNLNATYDGTPKAASVTTSPAGLANSVTYAGSPTPPTNAGTYTVVATITAPNYTGSATDSLVIAKASQTISFAALDPVPDDAGSFALTATASSGFAVSYISSNPSVATVSGNVVSVVGVGVTTITASQTGNANFNAASNVQQALTVVRANPSAIPGGPYSVPSGQSLALNGSSSQPSHGASITTYSWDLNNDGNFGDVTGATPAPISQSILTSTWGLSQGTNTIALRVTDSSGKSATASTTVEIIVNGLPLPWISADIGTGMLTGSATFSSGTFTLSGSGVIGGTSDRLHYTYQTLSGDGEITVRISSLQNTGNNSRVGVMIRESLAPNSKEIFMGLTGSGGYRWVRRTATGAATTAGNSSTGTVPNTWVRLVRSGETITAFKSINGTSWVSVGSVTNTLFGANCYIGLAVGSGSTTSLNTSQFTNVIVTP